MKELTIEEIVFFWSARYKYDHMLHGFTFDEKELAEEKTTETLDHLKSLYGDLL